MKTYKGHYKRVETHEADIYVNAENEAQAQEILHYGILKYDFSKEDKIFIDKNSYTSGIEEERIQNIVEVDKVPETSVIKVETSEDIDNLYDGTLDW